MAGILIGICIALFLLSLFFISGALSSIADAIKDLAHEVHVHAEVMTEIKHQGIGCDKNEI